jgi:transposase
LLDELIDRDLGAIEEELAQAREQVADAPGDKPQQLKRLPLPPELPRVTVQHEPDNTTCCCGCHLKRIGEDISEKLDYTPGTFTVERHVRGKWVCGQCETLTQAPVPAQVIDKGLPTSGLLAHLLVAKYGDHLPLYRQESIFARAFLNRWLGKLVCDDFAGYKKSFNRGITEIGCMAHARRKFFDLHASNKSQLAEYALQQIGVLYEIERHVKDTNPEQRLTIRQQQAIPILDALHQWFIAQRQKVPEGSGIAKAIDYSLKRWAALTRYCEDGHVPIDNNWVENQIRPWALCRSN